MFRKRRVLSVLIIVTFLLTQIFATPLLAATDSTSRIAGDDRYKTAVAISQEGWVSSDYAVLARGDDYADALAAGPLAAKYDAPILLTEPNRITKDVLDEIKRLGVEHLFIIGGTSAVSQSVENSVKGTGVTVERLDGAGRYETSVKVAQKLGSNGTVVLATGSGYADALSISVVAAKLGMPILLTSKDSLPKAVADYIKANNVSKTYLIGGTSVIGKNIESLVPNFTRIAGNDRYETNVAVLKAFKEQLDFDNIYVAVGNGPRGNEFADALAGSALAAKTSSPLVLVGAGEENLPAKTLDYLKSAMNLSSKAKGLGGKQVLASSVLTNILKAKESINVAKVYDKAGTYGPENGTETISGNVIISAADVVLKNTVIEGDLLLGQSIGNGDVELNGVTVKGKTIVNGGGPNSVILINFNGVSVIVNVPEGSNVRLVAQGNTVVNEVVVDSNGTLEEAEVTGEGFVNVVIPSGAEVVLSGEFSNVAVQGKGASVNVASGSIANMEIAESAAGAGVNIASTAKVETLNANAPVNVTGQGTITTANVNASGVVIEQKPTNVNVAAGVEAEVGGEKTDSTTTPPATGGGGGGTIKPPEVVLEAPVDGLKELTIPELTTENVGYLAFRLNNEAGAQKIVTLDEVKEFLKDTYNANFNTDAIKVENGKLSIEGSILSKADWRKIKADGGVKTEPYRITVLKGDKSNKVAKIAMYEDGNAVIEALQDFEAPEIMRIVVKDSSGNELSEGNVISGMVTFEVKARDDYSLKELKIDIVKNSLKGKTDEWGILQQLNVYASEEDPVQTEITKEILKVLGIEVAYVASGISGTWSIKVNTEIDTPNIFRDKLPDGHKEFLFPSGDDYSFNFKAVDSTEKHSSYENIALKIDNKAELQETKSIVEKHPTTGGDGVVFNTETLTFSGAIEYVLKNSTSEGFPPSDGNYVGVIITAPEGVEVDTEKATFKYTNQAGNEKTLVGDQWLDGENFVKYWPKVTAVPQTFTVEIDWDGEGRKYAPETIEIKIADGTTLERSPLEKAEWAFNSLNVTGDGEISSVTWRQLTTAVFYFNEAKRILGEDNTEVESLKERFKEVKKLDMSGKELTSLAEDMTTSEGATGVLVPFTGLEELDLSGTGVENIGGLFELQNIKKLNISNNAELTVEDLGALVNMKDLEELDISKTGIDNLNIVVEGESAKTRFPNLTVLKATDLKIESILGLTQLAGNILDILNKGESISSITWDLSGTVLSYTDENADLLDLLDERVSKISEKVSITFKTPVLSAFNPGV